MLIRHEMSASSVTPVPQTEFPTFFLVTEAIGYFKEQESAQEKERKQWLDRLDDSDGQSLPEAEKLLTGKLFSQGNAATRLENMGYKIGYGIVERLGKDIQRLPAELETVKFICKDFWIACFGKQVDNLRTNHQGIYVIQDNKFPLLTSFAEGTQYLDDSVLFLAMPAGIVRGALANLGVDAVVVASSDSLPTARFNISVKPKEEVKDVSPDEPDF